MQHRHLVHEQYTLAAIDDIIARGKRRDWAELRQAALADRSLFEKVLRVCQAHVADPYAQRYHFWKQYAERNLLPYDLEEMNLAEYKNLDLRWHDWHTVKAACVDCANLIFDQIVGR